MNLIRLAREGAALKAGAGLPYPSSSATMARARYSTLGTSWDSEAGPLWLSGVVYPCIAFKAMAVGEAEPIIERFDAAAGKWTRSTGAHESAWLAAFTQPNDEYGWRAIVAGVILSEDCAGNGFLVKTRNPARFVKGYRWEPAARIRLKPSTRDRLIPGYEYLAGSEAVPLDREDVVHTRAPLIDPYDQRLGLSPLASVLRDVVADNELSTWLASLLLNGGAPEWLFVPKADAGAGWTPEKAAQFRDYWNSFRRENRGGAMNAPAPIDAVRLSHSPADLQLEATRQGPSARICVALGMDPMVIGLPSTSKTYSNYAEAIDSFGKQTVLPTLARLAEQIGSQTLADFGMSRREYRVAWDTSRVTWLQDETDKLHLRVRDDFKAGVLDLWRAKELLGETPDNADKGVTYFALLARSRPTAASEPTKALGLLAKVREDREAGRVRGL